MGLNNQKIKRKTHRTSDPAVIFLWLEKFVAGFTPSRLAPVSLDFVKTGKGNSPYYMACDSLCAKSD